MTVIVVTVLLVVGAIAFFLWVLKAMLHAACPVCREEQGIEETVIPIIPLYRWFCPSCSNTFANSEIVRRADDESPEDTDE